MPGGRGQAVRYLDYPPVWLVGFLALAWAQTVLLPTPWAGDRFRGSHDQLLAGCTLYKRLYEMQFQDQNNTGSCMAAEHGKPI